jgi:Carboxypeptidase regulatory-like domain/TonB dependent receptor/TonB-dependent Receptor Plug Domain
MCAAPAAGQSSTTTADMVGSVTDSSQAVLPGATVTATNLDTNLSRSTTTDEEGRFFLPALPIGPYQVTAAMNGFETQTHQRVVLHLGSTQMVTFALKVAAQSESVNVMGDVPLVDTAQTAVSTVVSQQQIENLPINGRNFISFSVITPGVSSDQTPQQGASATSGLSFAGQRARSNNITVDGLDNNDITIGSVRAVFSQEAVREFQVLTNSYSAELGKAAGGVVNIVTRSGTNRPSGNAFFYGRDKALNAKNHFEKFAPDGSRIDREKAPFSQKQFGGILGGPIARDKTFYFASFERLDTTASNFVTIDDTTPIVIPGRSATATAAQILRGAGFPVETGNVSYDVRNNSLLAKVDHQLNLDQRLTLRYTYGDGLNENIEPFGGQVARSRAASLDSRDNMMAASHTAVISNRLVNELRFQFARRDQKVLSLDPLCDGECDLDTEGGPTLEVVGFASVGRQRFTPQPRLNDRYQVLETISLFTGRHQLKAGFDFNYVDHKEQSLPLHFGGRYIFRPLPAIPGVLPVPVSSIQALALGLPAAYVQGYGDPAIPYGYRDLSLFVQDDWRMTDRLTIKAGLRYQNQYWPDFEYRVAGYPNPYKFPSDNNNVAPRLAVSWDPFGDARTSIHAAYGIYYDNHITGMAGIARGINGEDNVQTLLMQFPNSLAGWNAPGHRLPRQAAPAVFPSVEISIDPGMKTPYAHHTSFGVERELPNSMALSASVVIARGKNQVGTIDYNPVVRSLGTNRRPEDVNGIPGTSASILQYTSFGETWYRGLLLSLTKRFANRHQFLVGYTLSKAEDNATDYQSAFIPQNNGEGRDDANPNGLPIGFDPDAERGPSLQDQRHRFVASGLYLLPFDVQVSSIVTIGSGRPYNILAGDDLNGDGDGGTFPPDRARTTPGDPASSVKRNAGTMPVQATVDMRVARRFTLGRVYVDGLFEVFNLFNRTNYTEINNIFGPGAYPSAGLPAFGQFTQAGPPLQVQLAARVSF